MSGGARHEHLVIASDGGARGNPGPAAIGAVVLDPTTDPPTVVASVSEAIGVATNNVAEWKAVIAGLEAALAFEPRSVEVRADSQLVIRQLEGAYRVKHPDLVPLHRRAVDLLARIDEVRLRHVPRAENTDADALVNAALDAAT
ncbi:MAG TPA: ribonuclease HI family protein [Acidimicrobiia bacterium]|nr:ribonuclease HI family protein [Acidimicrobiia bacterium]